MAAALILASTSRYRRELLARLRLPFDVERPDVDETPAADEPPAGVATRLAIAKAEVIAERRPGDWIIGSDQVAACDGRTLGKPGHRDAAIAQLRAMSGRSAHFLTAVALARSDTPTRSTLDTTVVRFRDLSDDEITRYVDAEEPYDCAGSFKSEGLGICLFHAIEAVDPTALVGLPLLATARLLRDAGYALP